MQEPSRIREEAQAAYREHEVAQAQGKAAGAQQQVCPGAGSRRRCNSFLTGRRRCIKLALVFCVRRAWQSSGLLASLPCIHAAGAAEPPAASILDVLRRMSSSSARQRAPADDTLPLTLPSPCSRANARPSPAQVASGAHEEAAAAAEHASETLRTGHVEPTLPGMGQPATGACQQRPPLPALPPALLKSGTLRALPVRVVLPCCFTWPLHRAG